MQRVCSFTALMLALACPLTSASDGCEEALIQQLTQLKHIMETTDAPELYEALAPEVKRISEEIADEEISGILIGTAPQAFLETPLNVIEVDTSTRELTSVKHAEAVIALHWVEEHVPSEDRERSFFYAVRETLKTHSGDRHALLRGLLYVWKNPEKFQKPTIGEPTASGIKAHEELPDFSASPLVYALSVSRFDIARTLIDSGTAIEPPRQTQNGLTHLAYAVRVGAPDDLILLMIEKGGNPNCLSFFAAPNALFFVTGNRSPVIYEALVKAGADPNLYNFAGKTLLDDTALTYERAKLLISLGAQINARDSVGRTALTRILMNADYHSESGLRLKGRIHHVENLIRLGAQVSESDRELLRKLRERL